MIKIQGEDTVEKSQVFCYTKKLAAFRLQKSGSEAGKVFDIYEEVAYGFND